MGREKGEKIEKRGRGGEGTIVFLVFADREKLVRREMIKMKNKEKCCKKLFFSNLFAEQLIRREVTIKGKHCKKLFSSSMNLSTGKIGKKRKEMRKNGERKRSIVKD